MSIATDFLTSFGSRKPSAGSLGATRSKLRPMRPVLGALALLLLVAAAPSAASAADFPYFTPQFKSASGLPRPPRPRGHCITAEEPLVAPDGQRRAPHEQVS